MGVYHAFVQQTSNAHVRIILRVTQLLCLILVVDNSHSFVELEFHPLEDDFTHGCPLECPFLT